MNKTIITEEQLNKMPHEVLISMYMQLSHTMDILISQNEKLLKQIDALNEKTAVLTQQLYGRKTETLWSMKKHMEDDDPEQLRIDIDTLTILNESEYTADTCGPFEEPEIETVVIKRRKRKGKREEDLKNVETVIDTHYLTEEELNERFPHGYDRLPDDVYSDLEFIPATFICHEHHVGVYAGKNHEGIIRGKRPERLLNNSILTPSLASGIFTAKYANAVPINRLSEEFARHDVNISRQVMAGWMIRLTERYLGIVYNAMRKKQFESRLIHCDETPFTLISDGRGSNSKSYMWVYHTLEKYGAPPIFIYQYSPTRSTNVIRESLKGYTGILLTDGYQAYHTLQNERPEEIMVAGCWEHAKRKFAEIVKAVNGKTRGKSIAVEATRRISAMYHVDNMCKNASAEERAENRKQSVRPMVDAYFEWLKTLDTFAMDRSGKLFKAIQYSLNQEAFLKKFLDDPIIPMDNNDAERSIRKFCIGKHSWHVIATPGGAESSAILYSISETARANGLKPFDYFRYLLEQILDHIDDPPETYLDSIMPWSEKLPESCRMKITKD